MRGFFYFVIFLFPNFKPTIVNKLGPKKITKEKKKIKNNRLGFSQFIENQYGIKKNITPDAK